MEDLWTSHKSGLHPAIIITPVPEHQPVSSFLPPPCGLTPCDNTDIVSSYNNSWQLRSTKQVRYRIVNLSNDDGGNPTVTQAQIQLQHWALTEAFRPYNITLDLSVHMVGNSSLRQRFTLSNCRIGKIGNRRCDPECDHPRTGHDGGDCLRLGPCYNWKRQDGVCNMECNSILYDYDDGDCCDPEVTDVLKTCFDPESPDRWCNSTSPPHLAMSMTNPFPIGLLGQSRKIFLINNAGSRLHGGGAVLAYRKNTAASLEVAVLAVCRFSPGTLVSSSGSKTCPFKEIVHSKLTIRLVWMGVCFYRWPWKPTKIEAI